DQSLGARPEPSVPSLPLTGIACGLCMDGERIRDLFDPLTDARVTDAVVCVLCGAGMRPACDEAHAQAHGQRDSSDRTRHPLCHHTGRSPFWTLSVRLSAAGSIREGSRVTMQSSTVGIEVFSRPSRMADESFSGSV